MYPLAFCLLSHNVKQLFLFLNVYGSEIMLIVFPLLASLGILKQAFFLPLLRISTIPL